MSIAHSLNRFLIMKVLDTFNKHEALVGLVGAVSRLCAISFIVQCNVH